MSDTHAGEVLTTQDGKPLKVALAKALRREKLRALALIAPLLIFVLLTFVAPIVDMLFRSVENGIVEETLPKTVVALQEWDPTSGTVPDEAVFVALYDDMAVAVEEKTHTRLGSRLNYEASGISSLFRKTGRGIKRMDEAGPFKEQFIDLDKDWGTVETWQVLKRFSPRYTPGYFLNAFDAQQTANGIELKPEDERIYMYLFGRTLFLSVAITVSCLLLGYPIAYLLSALPLRSSNLLMILVLLPFWTSLLVRTSAWKVLLQQQGVINDFLVWTGIISDAGRLVMINNQTGTIIAMTHILLPFMILPLYSVMKTISPSYVRAAKSLGANDWTAFWRVYFPQTIPGIGAGAVLVFILSIGYYITPELVGGTSGIFISNRIAYHISSSLNWGLGAALGTLLLVAVLVLFVVYDKIVGIDNVKLG
ncbi:ABC transporter permease [Roseibium aggregatum]|uniref:Polyamine ABC transporter, permease protein n=1 Tax=Roseibium aggregatum (strain ATCC 25650 / DSM 13394 / JCM 20685 / NBRC 16684 / NCIMB 2208 / IAM 12614 / B1) TaxID=384765 RepID=A0NU82_ROSAI|nr:ABC transporter permease [Roseibium aggregatum]EAV43484.1 polyamine ABC transporter, permease protein [Stappia aggregata IAM 12614] [Roseibium aggregatum IAM 12614]